MRKKRNGTCKSDPSTTVRAAAGPDAGAAARPATEETPVFTAAPPTAAATACAAPAAEAGSVYPKRQTPGSREAESSEAAAAPTVTVTVPHVPVARFPAASVACAVHIFCVFQAESRDAVAAPTVTVTVPQVPVARFPAASVTCALHIFCVFRRKAGKQLLRPR